MTDPADGGQVLARVLAAAFPDGTGRGEPALLPTRLAKACAEVLGVDGAGLSLFIGADLRVPIGGSSDDAMTAERLQFTLGDGPCFAAHHQGRTIVAKEHVMAREWPPYHQELLTQTAYRAVVSLPLLENLQGMGALDLYLPDDAGIDALVWADVRSAVNVVMSLLSDSSEDGPPPAKPAWLDNAAVDARAKVWIAMGLLSAGLTLSTTDALSLLRAYSYIHGRTVDATAEDLCTRRLPVHALADG